MKTLKEMRLAYLQFFDGGRYHYVKTNSIGETHYHTLCGLRVGHKDEPVAFEDADADVRVCMTCHASACRRSVETERA